MLDIRSFILVIFSFLAWLEAPDAFCIIIDVHPIKYTLFMYFLDPFDSRLLFPNDLKESR
jgi:hypothetical protein